MFTRRMLFRRLGSKAGMSTVFGMLIFIGVLFTCVIPLFLYVNQVNSYYDQAVIEMRHIDEDKQREMIDVYAYPYNTTSKAIYVYVKNQCPFSVDVIRIWVNDHCYNYTLKVPGLGWNVTEAVDLTGILPPEGNITIDTKVTTRRGNIVSSLVNPLYYSAAVGWSSSGTLSINVVINRDHQGTDTFNIKITKIGTGEVICDEDVRLIGNTKSYVKRVCLPQTGTYSAIVKCNGFSVYEKIDIQISFGAPCYWVYVSV